VQLRFRHPLGSLTRVTRASTFPPYNLGSLLAYSSEQTDGVVADFVRASNYTFARSRDNKMRTIENVTTDGAVAVVTKIANTRNIYASGIRLKLYLLI
jgi:hypothetical protein